MASDALDVAAVEWSGQADLAVGPSGHPFATVDVGGHQPGGAGQGIVIGQDGAAAVAQSVAAAAASLGHAVGVGGREEGTGVDVLLVIRRAPGPAH